MIIDREHRRAPGWFAQLDRQTQLNILGARRAECKIAEEARAGAERAARRRRRKR